MYRLHGFGQSGNSFKVAFALRALGQPFETVPVDFFNGETRSEAWRAAHNEMGEAPVLEDGPRRLTQSGLILLHLADKHGRFGGRSPEERDEILRWILFDNHKFTSYYATLRFLYGLQKTGETPVTEFLRARAKSAFHILDKHLSTRAFVVGERLTIADISLCGYAYYDEETGINRADFPHIEAWKARIAAMPGWAHPYALMPRAFTP